MAISIGEHLTMLREKAGLTQTEASRQSGIPQSLWSAYEGGRQCPMMTYQKVLARLQAIATTLNCTLDDLIKPLTPPENTQ